MSKKIIVESQIGKNLNVTKKEPLLSEDRRRVIGEILDYNPETGNATLAIDPEYLAEHYGVKYKDLGIDDDFVADM